MTKTPLLAWLVACSFLLNGCGAFSSSNGSQFRGCPSLSDNITWNTYGSYTILKEGPDQTARDIISHCNWHVYEGNNGGAGNTLQIAPPNEGVIFVWAFNEFAAFTVKNGWTGQTDRGAKLGDSQSSFLTLYPEFPVFDGAVQAYQSPNGCITVTPTFVNGSLAALDIDHPNVFSSGSSAQC